MFLIVGLGNPGKKFQKTRHNIGFRVIDEFFKKNRDVHHFSNFKLVKKFNSLISEGIFNKNEIILAKPQTFMNLSGKSVRTLLQRYSLNTAMASLSEEVLVVHDDVDLPLGKIRISIGRGSAGHKGVESIIKELSTKNFVRFRIGIKPKQYHRLVCDTEKFVLQKFTKDEEKIVNEVIKKTIKAIEFYLMEGLEKTMSKYNE